MSKQKEPRVRQEFTVDQPLRAWVRRTKRGLRAFRYYHQGHFYRDPHNGQQRRTNWIAIAVDVVREFSLKGTCLICNRDNTVLIDTIVGARGFFAFVDGVAEEESPYRGETFVTGATEINDGERWAMGWRTAASHLGNA